MHDINNFDLYHIFSLRVGDHGWTMVYWTMETMVYHGWSYGLTRKYKVVLFQPSTRKSQTQTEKQTLGTSEMIEQSKTGNWVSYFTRFY